MKLPVPNWPAVLLASGQRLRSPRWFWLAAAAAGLAALAMRSVWFRYGDHNLVSLGSVDFALGLVLLNFILALIALPREPYAGALLVGAALAEETLVIIFLYRV